MDEVEVAVMLADVSGSTALYEKVGNVEALKQISACLDLLRDVIERNGGQFISSKGDDVLCIFKQPNAVLNVGMQMFEQTENSDLSLHAGVDFGKVIYARNDVFGDSVNMAARLATVAKSGEILCSQELYDQLGRDYRTMLRFFGPRHFKGKTALSNIYLFSEAVPGLATEVTFSEEDEMNRANAARLTGDGVKAALRFGYETLVCSAENPVQIGRAPECDLVIPFPWVSRTHATIEIRGDQVYLIDNSTSGTFVAFAQQIPFVVRRESHLLHDACTLSLARSHADVGAQIISLELLKPTAETT